MKYPTLESPRAKLGWAARHFEVLDRDGRAWENSHPYRVRGQLNREKLEYRGGIAIEKPSPDLSLLLGDYVHNLRSALDHLVWQLVIANGEVPGKRHQFPIACTDTEWEQAIRNGWLGGVEPDAVTLIKALQPNCGKRPPDEHLLSGLSSLDISDKHHILAAGALGVVIPVVNEGKRAWGMRILSGSGTLSAFELKLPSPVVEDEADFVGFRFSEITPDFEMQMHDDFATVELRFGEPGTLDEFSVTLEDLANMGYFVQYAINQFDPSSPQRGARLADH